MTAPDNAGSVADARRAVHESLTALAAWDADDVRAKVAALEQAVEQQHSADNARLVAMIERGYEQHMRFGVIDADGTTQMQPCADWCYACKLEQLRADLEQAPSRALADVAELRNEVRRQAAAALRAWGAEGEKRRAGDEVSPFYVWEDADRAADVVEGMIE